MTHCSDIIILGAGMAGASLAAELSPERSVTVVEVEDQPGRHSTGRSAAMFFGSYGNATIRGLTRASRQFLQHPPEGFVDGLLMRQRTCLIVAGPEGLPAIEAMHAAPDARHMQRLSASEAIAVVPILNRDWVTGALVENDSFDIDVAALHQGYLRASRRNGVSFALDARETKIERRGSVWRVQSRAGVHEAPILVNATGAWADVVAGLAGAQQVGLQPKRRTAFMTPGPASHDFVGWPAVVDAEESFYFKPDGGQLLVSPANEDPVPPCDVAPEELDIAIAVDRFERATTLAVTKVSRPWAGLRSFVRDKSPVVGFDTQVEGFFWLAGQGGYGIQTAPGMARTAAELILRGQLPEIVLAEGVTEEALSPSRGSIGVRLDSVED